MGAQSKVRFIWLVERVACALREAKPVKYWDREHDAGLFSTVIKLERKKIKKEKASDEKIKTDSQFDKGTNRELVLKPHISFGSKYDNSTAALRSLQTI